MNSEWVKRRSCHRDCYQSRELTMGSETGVRRGRDNLENLYVRTEPALVPFAIDVGSSIHSVRLYYF